MKEKQNRIIVTFYTTAEAMATKKLCQERNIPGKLISAPRKLSADCGIAWCSECSLKDTIENALREAKIEFAGLHEILI